MTSVNVAATVKALTHSLRQVRFAACKLLTDHPVGTLPPEIERIPIARLGSAEAYSRFILRALPDFIDTEHCLIIQWDGHVLDANRWRQEFLEYDYVGASWPQFDDGMDVGNGGFSLRSKALMDLCRGSDFVAEHPEDVAIGRTHRPDLERRGVRFAPRAVADLFSAERSGDPATTFGFHGVWNMPGALGRDEFWARYVELDDRSSIRPDFWPMVGSMIRGIGGPMRAARMIWDRWRPVR
ncbi:DUF5672 family protein [Novosphingobium sp.]|uniref:DUF5672 family protein n=1 Tax=Novosphingobium sp. TaxID=1874826 RepID=UPI0026359DB6|nr:DUF5672 family protein [Novosphingobium sp.]